MTFRGSTAGKQFAGFSWHSDDPDIVAKARLLVTDARAASRGRKASVAWDTMIWIEGGIFMRWKARSAYAAGYNWYSRMLGKLALTLVLTVSSIVPLVFLTALTAPMLIRSTNITNYHDDHYYVV